MDFADIVSQTKTGERDYIARLSTKGTEFIETPSLFVKSIDEAKRQIEAVVSDASIDREGEIILPSAFREMLGIYLANPVVISAHQHRLETGHSSVVGQTVKAWIDNAGLHVTIWFAETELGNEMWYLYSKKFQRAFSVGFIPLEWKDEAVEGRTVRTFTKVELLEISCVPVPANRNALSKSKQRKADFIAAKIADRQLANAGDDFEAELAAFDFEAVGLTRPTEEGGFELDGDLGISEKSIEEDNEPDYGRIASKQSSSDFYNE